MKVFVGQNLNANEEFSLPSKKGKMVLLKKFNVFFYNFNLNFV